MDKWIFIFAQIAGLIAVILSLISDGVKDRKNIYLFNGISNGVSALEYFLLSGYTGAISCLIAVVRNFIFSRFKKNVPIFILIIYIIIAVGLQITSINNFFDILPLFNICVYAIALGTNNGKVIKIVGMFVCFPSIIYSFYYKAYVTTFFDTLSVFISLGSYYVYYIKNKKTKKNKKKRRNINK